MIADESDSASYSDSEGISKDNPLYSEVIDFFESSDFFDSVLGDLSAFAGSLVFPQARSMQDNRIQTAIDNNFFINMTLLIGFIVSIIPKYTNVDNNYTTRNERCFSLKRRNESID